MQKMTSLALAMGCLWMTDILQAEVTVQYAEPATTFYNYDYQQPTGYQIYYNANGQPYYYYYSNDDYDSNGSDYSVQSYVPAWPETYYGYYNYDYAPRRAAAAAAYHNRGAHPGYREAGHRRIR